MLNVFVLIESGGGYDPREMLSDAVATMVFMPTKFERTSYQLAEKFNFSVHDVNTLTVSFSNQFKSPCKQNNSFKSYVTKIIANNVS